MPELAVTAIIPTYNRSHLVGRAIESALAAIGPGDEILVADDGSSDDTPAVVEAFGSPVRLLRLPHGGAAAARNAAVAAAKGPLVAFLDDDDEWFPDKIALQRRFLEARPDLLFVVTDLGVKLEDGTEHRRALARWVSPPRPLSDIFTDGFSYSSVAPLPEGRPDFTVYAGSMYRTEMLNCFIWACTVMARKDRIGDALEFGVDFPNFGEEWPAFGRMTGRGPGAVFATETAWQHGHSGPRLTNVPMHTWAQARLMTLERVWGRDGEFLREHQKEFDHAVAEARLISALSRARHGDLREVPRAIGISARHPAALRGSWLRTFARRSW